MGRPVQLLVTSSYFGLAVIGLLRPLIVLPEVIVSGKSAKELEAFLAHELIHVRRGDLWLGLLQVCARAVWWFYPVVSFACRISTREAERCCDEEVIGALQCDPKRYALSLLHVLELKRTLQPVPAFPGMKPVEVTTQRLERIMKLGQGCHRNTPRWCWAIMLLVSAAALPGAAFIAADEVPKQGVVGPAPQRTGSALPPRPWRPKHRPMIGTQLAPMTASSYQARQVLAALKKELSCNDRQALQAFGNLLILASPTGGESRPIQDRIHIWKGAVHVFATAEEHKRMAAAVEQMKKFGVTLVTVDIQVAVARDRVVDAVIKEWQLSPAQIGSAPRAATRFPDAAITPPRSAKAGITTTNELPAIYKVLSAARAEKVRSAIRADEQTEVLSHPRLFVQSGQTASISVGSRRPFVVGVKSVEGAAQPQVRVIDCGLQLRIRPTAQSGKNLTLECDIKRSDIEDVRTTTVRAAGFEQPVTLQVPRVQEVRFESTIESAFGKTVVIGGLPAAKRLGKRRQLLVLLTATRNKDLLSHGIKIKEATGKPMFGIGVNSDAGATGEVLAVTGARPKLPPAKVDSPLDTRVYPSVYNVADLVTTDLRRIMPPGHEEKTAGPPLHRAFDILVSAIEKGVAPASWKGDGGRGAVESFTTNLSLVVSQDRDTHEQVAEFLQAQREKLGLPKSPPKKQTASRPLPQKRQSSGVISIVYPVADLVVPTPNFSPETKHGKRADAGPVQLEFDRLISLIRATVRPNSWEEGGGRGKIAVFPSDLSIVVSNTPAVHAEVNSLLKQLGRLLDIQVTLETRAVQLPKTHMNFLRVRSKQGAATSITTAETAKLVAAIQGVPQATVLIAPKVTLFNAQEAWISLSPQGNPDASLRLQAVCAGDLQTVRISAALRGRGVSSKPKLVPLQLATGHTMMLSVTDDADAIWGRQERDKSVPILKQVPYVSKLFESPPPRPDFETFLLVTPKIIIPLDENREPRVWMATPRGIIIQEEEEELLGIDFDAPDPPKQ